MTVETARTAEQTTMYSLTHRQYSTTAQCTDDSKHTVTDSTLVTGATENAGVENAIRAKLQGWKMQEWKMREQIAGVENALWTANLRIN